jgi:hypothetical protein
VPGRDDEERRLSARLQTVIGAGSPAGLTRLRDDAARRLGPGHEVALAAEHALEVHRDATRRPIESRSVWARLGQRAAASLPPGSPAARSIRARYRRHLLCCGRPSDLAELIELCRAESDPDARLDQALALRDRARFDESASTSDLADALALADALDLAESEIRRRGDDHLAAAAARQAEVEILLAIGRSDADAAARGLQRAEAMTGDEIEGARVLLAEALLLTGQVAAAGRVARLAYALSADAFDPARALLVVARTEPVAEGRATARAAAAQRASFFPAESHYVVEARRLAEELSRC